MNTAIAPATHAESAAERYSLACNAEKKRKIGPFRKRYTLLCMSHEPLFAASQCRLETKRLNWGMSLKDIPHEDIQGFCVHKEQ